MNFGKVYRYMCKLGNEGHDVYRILAQSREEADSKFKAYVSYCERNGANITITVDSVEVEKELVLY